MIPASTTLTPTGRRIRSRIMWSVAAVAVLFALTFAFLALDRSTVVDGPDGSSFVTTATGLAALADTLERDGRQVVRIRRPLDPTVTNTLDSYVIADAGFGQYEASEVTALTRFVEEGGTVWILGVAPRSLQQAFELDAEWVGQRIGRVPVLEDLPHTSETEGARFGSFRPDHSGTTVAGDAGGDLVVRYQRGQGAVVLVADSSVAHNATVARADNIDLFGDLIGNGPIGFDEFRHGFREDAETTGLIASAPGNWTGALALGAIVLVIGLVTYGRRLGPAEPTARPLVPDRSEYLDAMAHRLHRAGGVEREELDRILAELAGRPR